MALADLLTYKPKKIGAEITEETLLEHLDEYRELIAYWRDYPDRLIDYYCSLNPHNTFHLYFYQRLFLRVVMRHKMVYATFVRAWSKSFMSDMALMLKCILYPGAKVFSAAGGKEQSASILQAKVSEICKLIPAMSKEIVWDTRGRNDGIVTRITKDSVTYGFKNGSSLQNLAASQSSRGQRFQSGLLEECVGIDQDILNEVLIPTMNVSRHVNSETDPNEPLNKSQVFITTAGYKNTFAYEKLIQIFCQSVARPDQAMILGGTWRVPVIEGLLDRDFVTQLKLDGTFNEASFAREYESHWTGDVESAFFSNQIFDKHRQLNLPEYKYNGRINSNGYYVLGVDVGRLNCTTEIVVIKVTPVVTGAPLKQIVNIFTIDAENFLIQCIKIKKVFEAFHCKAAVVDGNGLGVGLIDLLVNDQEDPETGDLLANWGVINDEVDQNTGRLRYKQFENGNTIHNALYIMKANVPLNSEMYAYCETQMRHGRIKFLIDDSIAKGRLAEQSQNKNMKPEERAQKLLPYVQTNILKDQMANLIRENPDNPNIILKPNNHKINHDKVSALIYGLYYCKMQEDKGKKRSGRDLSSMMLYTKAKR